MKGSISVRLATCWRPRAVDHQGTGSSDSGNMAALGATVRSTWMQRVQRSVSAWWCTPSSRGMTTGSLTICSSGVATHGVLQQGAVTATGWAEWKLWRPVVERLDDFMDGLLLAAPKKRTTHSKKLKRMTHKYLKRTTSMMRCEMCDGWKRPHMYCTPKCPGRRESSAMS